MRLKRDLPETSPGGIVKGIYGGGNIGNAYWIHTKSCTKPWVGMSNFLCGQNDWRNDWCDYKENMVD